MNFKCTDCGSLVAEYRQSKSRVIPPIARGIGAAVGYQLTKNHSKTKKHTSMDAIPP